MNEAKRITPRPVREEQAWQEVGHTEFSPGVAVALIVIFLGIILLGPLVQALIPRSTFNALLGGPRSEVDPVDPSDRPDARKVSATVVAVSARPRRDAVYRDFVMRLHVENLQDESGTLLEPEAILGVLGMRDRVIQAAAGIQAGTQIEATIQPWSVVAGRVDGMNASSLEGDRFLLMNQWWAASLTAPGANLLPGAMDFSGIWCGRGNELPDDARIGVLRGMRRAWSQGAGFLDAFLAANAHLARRIRLYETALDDEAVLALVLRRHVQAVLASVGVGNEKAIVGRDGWLFFVPGVHGITGRGFLDPMQLRDRVRGGDALKAPPRPDPRLAILGLRDQLAERGIELVIMPTPVKPSIHAGKIATRLASHSKPLRNRSFDACVDELRAAGVRVFDPAPLIMARKKQGVQYLATDTHWRPEAMQAVAEALADEVAPLLAERVPTRWSTEEATHRQLGDIATMLDMAAWQTAVDPETVTVKRVVDADGEAWRPSSDSEVLLLGDSFSNIYSLEGMGWGGASGLAEHLSLALQRPLDRLCRNDAGAHTSRGMLAQALLKDPHFLDGKRVVVWQFAERELSVGDWKAIELAAAHRGETVRDSEANGESRPARGDARPPSGPAEVSSGPGGRASPRAGSEGASIAENVRARFRALVEQAEATDAVAAQGKDDWIFLVSELRHMASRPAAEAVPDDPGADPFSALVDLHVKLRELDVQLILLPVPPRAAIYADKLLDDVPRDANGQVGRVDTGLKAFYEALQREGVQVLDLTDSFLAARARDDELGPVCCEQDTHWSPRGIRIAAEAVAAIIAEMDWSSQLVPANLHRGEQTRLEYVGDLVDRIAGHAETTSLASIARVVASKDSHDAVASDSESPIILLADSHGLVFSSGGEMHCTGAGLAEQIAFELDTTLDVMARRGSGDSVRRDLARRFLRNPDLPATKRLVIYCFAARTFTESTGWKPVPLQR